MKLGVVVMLVAVGGGTETTIVPAMRSVYFWVGSPGVAKPTITSRR